MKNTPSTTLLVLNLVLVTALVATAVVLLARGTGPDLVLWAPQKAMWTVTGIVFLVPVVMLGMPLVTVVLAIIDLGTGCRTQGLLAGGTSAILILVFALWTGLVPLLASQEETRASASWARTLDPIETFTDRYPTASTSAGALRIEMAAARIGIELNRREQTERQVGEPARSAYDAVRKELWAFVTSQTQKPDETPDSPTRNVTAWLSARESGVADLVNQVLHAEAIALETDWFVDDGPSWSLLGFRGVRCILVLQALEKTRAGDWHGALDALEASWRVGGALRDRGELLSQLLAIADDEMTLAVLRKVQNVPESWHARIAQLDYRMSYLRALEGEAWKMSSRTRRLTALRRGGHPARGWLWLALEGPYLRLMAANYSLALSRVVGSLRQVDPCSLDSGALRNEIEASLPNWNFLGRMSWPPLRLAAFRVAGMSLDVELSRKVLAARRLKARSNAWPARLPDLESRVCPGSRWIYTTSDDGSVSLTFDRQLSALKPPVFHAQAAPAAP